MSDSRDRFYQMELQTRPALWGDVGSLVSIEGLMVGGASIHEVLLLPSVEIPPLSNVMYHHMSVEEWSDFIQRSDNPEILVQGSNEKVFHRKLRYVISGHVQQKVWAADGFKCMYCMALFGDRLMTIDHFIPLEEGGANDVSNYLSACRPCNKDKANEHPESWLDRIGKRPRYEMLVDYLKRRVIQ